MEVAALVLGVLGERMRPDLWLRRWCAALPRLGGRRPVPVPVALAGVESRRLILRASTVIAAVLLVRVFAAPWPSNAYGGVNRVVGTPVALVGVVVLALLASIGGRDRDLDLVAATPSPPRRRLASWILFLGTAAAMEYLVLVAVRFGRSEPSYAALLPDAWEIGQGPLLLLGAGLLGVLLARLLPAWVAAALGVLVVIAWVGVLSGTFDQAMLAPVVEWIQYREDEAVVVEPGSFAWHNAYLLGLCGLGVAALMLTAPGPRRRWFVLGALLAVGTAVAGALALP